MPEQLPQEIPGVTRPFTFNEAAIEARRRVEEQIAQGFPPSPVPISFKDPVWPSPDGKGTIHWDPTSNQHVISANDRSKVKPGSALATGITGNAEVINPSLTLPRDSQN